jgi:large subunit ribosomal protein L1
MSKEILEAIKKARNTKRNFNQTFDLIINLKNIDLKKPENRVKTEVFLPHGKPNKIGFIADTLATEASKLENVEVIKKNQLESLGRNKKLAKKLANDCYFFIAEAPLMPLIGKNLGPILAPRNKMPKPIPPTANPKPIVEKISKTIRVVVKTSPVVQCPVGSEDIDDEKIEENIELIIKAVESNLPRGKEQIKSYCIKTTMGKPVKV